MNNNSDNNFDKSKKNCPKCGKPIKDDSVFCGECGYRLDDEQNGFKPPYYHPEKDTPADKLTLGDYLIMLILFQIPIVGLIMMFIWGFSQGYGTNRKNFARAYLIFSVITYILSLIMTVIIMGLFSAVGSSVIEEGITLFPNI